MFSKRHLVDSSLKSNFEECEPQAPKARNMLARGKCERSEARRPWIDASKAASALKVRNRNPLNTRAMSLLQSSVQFGATPRGGALRYRSALPPQRGCRAGDPGWPLATLFRAVGAKSKARCINARCTSKLNSRMTNDLKGLGELVGFDPHDDEDLPFYVLYDISERPLYVGQAQNIKTRIRTHRDKFWFRAPIVQTGAFVQIDEADLREKVETLLIRFLKSNAVINKQKVDRETL